MKCRHLVLLAFVGLFVVAYQSCGPNSHYRPHGHQDITLAVSPQGDALVFNAVGAGGRDLYLFDLVALTVTRVAETPDYEVDASFLPDGRLVYAAGMPGDRADHLFLINRDGRGKTQLTDADANDAAPSASPDGSMIVFSRAKTYLWGGKAANWSGEVICVVAADGLGERQLTPDEMFAYSPCFSPDGAKILFLGPGGVHRMPVDGSQPPARIGPLPDDLCLTPDGARVIHPVGKYSKDQELIMTNLDGSAPVQLTSSDEGSVHPAITPDGAHVYFVREHWPNGASGVPKFDLWRVNSDGKQEVQIADSLLFDDPTNWRPPTR